MLVRLAHTLPHIDRRLQTNFVIAKKLLEKSELLKGLMQGTSPLLAGINLRY